MVGPIFARGAAVERVDRATALDGVDGFGTTGDLGDVTAGAGVDGVMTTGLIGDATGITDDVRGAGAGAGVGGRTGIAGDGFGGVETAGANWDTRGITEDICGAGAGAGVGGRTGMTGAEVFVGAGGGDASPGMVATDRHFEQSFAAGPVRDAR